MTQNCYDNEAFDEEGEKISINSQKTVKINFLDEIATEIFENTPQVSLNSSQPPRINEVSAGRGLSILQQSRHHADHLPRRLNNAPHRLYAPTHGLVPDVLPGALLLEPMQEETTQLSEVWGFSGRGS